MTPERTRWRPNFRIYSMPCLDLAINRALLPDPFRPLSSGFRNHNPKPKPKMKSFAAPSRRALVIGLVCVFQTLVISSAFAASQAYTWKSVQIQGGGFIPGIIFNQTQPNLIYARSDIGSAYRWNQASNSWIPLNDSVGWNNWGTLGCVSLATDPVNPNNVYVAAGMYTNGWDPNNGVILRSSDQGNTWASTPLPFTLG